MENLRFPPQDFAFPLPLHWPQREQDHDAFQETLIDYAKLMIALLEASEGSATEALLESLTPVLESLPDLWSPANRPAEVSRLIAVVKERQRKE